VSRGDWERLAASAQERGLLDDVDRALIDTLAAKALRENDLAFRVVLACLVAAVREGGLRIPIAGAELESRMADWLRGLYSAAAPEPGVDPDPRDFPEPVSWAARMAEEFTAARMDGAYSAALGRPGDFLPLIEFGSGLYFQRYHAAEALVGARLRMLIDAPDQAHAPAAAESALGAVLERYPLHLGGPAGPAMRFEGAQRAAMELALRKRFTVISGGPGTGKTSLAANLLRAWLRLRAGDGSRPQAARPPRIKLAAPTGRAAQRLAESLHQSLASLAGPDPDPVGLAADAAAASLGCSTLHALLRYQPSTGGFFHHAHRPLPADLVVVDEVSMVDIFLLARLLDALEPDACLVLLGDMDQLPSVEAGSVLADLAPSGASGHPLRGNLAALDRGHRSGASILQVTRWVNAMDADAALAAMLPPVPVLPPPWPAIARKGPGERSGEGEGCRMLLPPAGQAYRAGLEACLDSWMAFHYLGRDAGPAPRPAYGELVAELCASREAGARAGLLAEAFAYLDQARILTFTRKGWHGAVHINRILCERLARRLDPHAPAAGPGFAGMPILVLENDPARGLFNGDVGLQLRMGGRSLAWFRRAEGFQEFPIAFLPRHEPAFAMTIHKSQGSEYDQILLVLPEGGNRLLFKETLYTAITRARHFAGIYGPVEVFREAIARKVIRESGLAEYLSPAPPPR
jgi:exodeoxyribonuclease V alpha subunit